MRGRVICVVLLTSQDATHPLAGKPIHVVEVDTVPSPGDEWALPGDSECDGPLVRVLKRQWEEHCAKCWVTVQVLEHEGQLIQAPREEVTRQ